MSVNQFSKRIFSIAIDPLVARGFPKWILWWERWVVADFEQQAIIISSIGYHSPTRGLYEFHKKSGLPTYRSSFHRDLALERIRLSLNKSSVVSIAVYSLLVDENHSLRSKMHKLSQPHGKQLDNACHELDDGFEPSTSSLRMRCSNQLS